MNPIQIIFKGLDQTKGATDSVKRGLEGVEGAAKKTSSSFDTAMGVLAADQVQRFADAVSGFMTSSLNEAIAAQDGMAQLEEVIKSTGGAAGLTADEVSEMAEAFSEVTRFEDDAIAAGQTILLQFTKIGEETFPRASETMLDLATRMKIDLPNAAKIVGKALEGEFSGLARYGVKIDEQTEKTIKGLLAVGDTAGAQALILAELEKRFGGAAEAAGSTLGGSIDRLNNAWGNLKETIGTALAENEGFQDAVDALVKLVNALGDGFAKLPEPVQTGGVALLGLGAIAAKIAVPLLSLKVLLGGGAAAGGAAAAGGGLAGMFSSLGGAASGAAAAIGGAIGAITLPVAALAVAIGALVALIIGTWPTLSTIFEQWGILVVAVLERIWFELKKWINDWIAAFKALPGQFKSLWEGAGRSIVQGLWSGIQGAWEWLKNNVKTALDNLLEWINNAIGAHSPADAYKPTGRYMAQGISAGFTEGMQRVSPTMSAAVMPRQTLAAAPAYGGGMTVNVTGGFYSPVTHAERARIRREQESAAISLLGKVLKR